MRPVWIATIFGLFATIPVFGDPKPSTKGAVATTNAAPIYWLAFTAVPAFETPEEQNEFDVAGRSSPQLPLSPEVIPLIERYSMALKQMHRAARLSDCDWGLDTSDGPMMQLPHLAKGRELARAALLRARLRLELEDRTGAIDDIVATLRMARHLGISPILISFLVDVAVEKGAVELLAMTIPKMNPAMLNRLTKDLAALPEVPSLAACLTAEGEFFSEWISREIQAEKSNKDFDAGKLFKLLVAGDDESVKRLRTQFEALSAEDLAAANVRLSEDYMELAQIAAKPSFADRREAAAAFFDELRKDDTDKKPVDQERILSLIITPAIQRVVEVEERSRLRREMISLAILVQRKGPDSLKNSNSPDAGKIEYQRTEKGFELRHDMAPTGTPEVLKVGSLD